MEAKISRIAVGTGGTDGIGAAIAIALHAEGYKVAANYAGNDAAAAAFNKETGMAIFKWNVSVSDKAGIYHRFHTERERRRVSRLTIGKLPYV